MSFRCDRAALGPWAIDLAALSLGAPEPAVAELRRRHRDVAEHPGAADEAFLLAEVAVLLRELPHDPGAAVRLRERLRPEPSPATVRVFVDGPAWARPERWARPGDEVPSAQARWLLRTLDGLSVGGEALRVATEPALRPGKASPREPRSARRRRLFSRWSEGVRTDAEGLLSATPEALALALAEGARGVIVDGTAGVGGLAIAYARQPAVRRVVAVERDAERLAMAVHNARLYGVADRIEPLEGDLLERLPDLRGDLLVLDPPWGGAGYDRARVRAAELPFDLVGALARWRGPALLKLPRSFDPASLPGRWTPSLAVDERGVVKFLVLRGHPP